MIMCMYKICITNRKLVKGDFIVQLKKIVKTDVSAVILREKDLDEAAYEELLKQVMPVCKQADIPLIAHKYINAAIKNGISYIHLPFSDFVRLYGDNKSCNMDNGTDCSIAREAVISNSDISYYKDKEKLRIGTSVHSAKDAIYAMKHGAAYVTAGHVFATDCKKGLEPRGLHFLKDVCCNVDIPVYAIGGINENNMESCIKAGAAGVCMMSGYMTL